MQRLFLLWVLLITTSLCNSLIAKTVVISDIDDTLKISHVRHKVDAFFGIFRSRAKFAGMPRPLNQLAKEGATIYYLSNAPEWLMQGPHHRFLQQNHFPSGKVILRKKLSKEQHKLYYLRQIINQETPDTLILIGDNGQSDATFYQQIIKEFPQIKIYSFIHFVYAQQHFSTLHHYFVTPMKIFITLRELGIIDDSTATEQLEKLASQILMTPFNYHHRGFIPTWVNCRGYHLATEQESDLVNLAARKIERRCNEQEKK